MTDNRAPAPIKFPTKSWLCRTWTGFITSPEYEAVLLLVIYAAIRWFKELRNQSVIILLSALAVIMKELLKRYGNCFLKFERWIGLAKDGYEIRYVADLSCFESITGFALIAPLVWFMPLYFLSLPWSILYALSCEEAHPDVSHSAFWAKLGAFTYEKILANKYMPAVFYDARREKAKMEQAQVSPTPATVHFLFFISILLAIPYGLSVFALLVVCYITGEHLSICVLVGLEIFTSVRNVDLGKYEVFVGIGYLFPVITYVNFRFLKKLIPVTLAALKRDLGPSHRLSKMTEIYHAVPIDATERMFKIWDTARGKGAGESRPYWFVESVHEPTEWRSGDSNEYKCCMLEKEDDWSYMDGMLTGEKKAPLLRGRGWKGLSQGEQIRNDHHFP